MAQLERGKLCPMLKKDCVGLQCSWYTQVRGTHPQTGRDVDEYACAIAWMPMLLIETSKEVRQGAAAAESMRNEMVGVVRSAVTTSATLAGAMLGCGAPPLVGNDKKEG